MRKNRFDFSALLPGFLKKTAIEEPAPAKSQPSAMYGFAPGYGLSMSISFTGEKSQGGIGPIVDYKMDHKSLAMRAWQLFLESDDCQIVVSKHAIWAVGTGLKLQAEPNKLALKTEGIEDDLTDFSETVEARFDLFSNSTFSDYAEMDTLHEQANQAFITANLSGNCLVVIRLVGNIPKVQLIDGIHLTNPMNLSFGETGFVNPDTNNRIVNGVELSETGEHIAYHVRTGLLKTERIEAKIGKYNLVQAFLIRGMRYKIDTILSIPVITSVMETAKKLERYTQAALATAEERAKISLAIEHEVNSTGENPFTKSIAEANGYGNPSDIPVDQQGEKLRSTVAATTEKQVVNLTPGATIKTLSNDTDINFKDFSGVHSDKIAAVSNIPPNVASGKYDTSYSSSRASNKDWEHNLGVTRKRRVAPFYQYVYQYWLFVEIHLNKIKAPGYLKALKDNNIMALAAYHKARWVGAQVPHIDPLKEVLAQREAMGILGKFLPMSTGEAATESLANGDFQENMAQFFKELEIFKTAMESLGLPMPNFTGGNAGGASAENEREGKTAES